MAGKSCWKKGRPSLCHLLKNMQKKDFTASVASSRNNLIYLVTGKDRGRACWHYVKVEQLKLPLFLEKVKSDFIDVADYGDILRSGWGEQPSDDVKNAIVEEYGS